MRILSLFTKHRSALSAVGTLLEGLHAVEKAKQSGSPFPADGLPLYCRLFYFRMVFLPCGRAAAQMTLGLVPLYDGTFCTSSYRV